MDNLIYQIECISRHTPNIVFKEHGLHFDFSIDQFVQAAFVSGMPYLHVEMPYQERTDGLVQHVEEEPSAKLEMSSTTKIQKIKIIHECNTPIQE
jgi:hypothetical protein